MAFLDGRLKEVLNKVNVKKLTNTPKIAIMLFLMIVFGLTLIVILNADKRTQEEVTTTEIKVEETEEYDDKFVKNQADLLGYEEEKEKKNMPKSLKEEEYNKIFAQDPAFQMADKDNPQDNTEEEFLKEAGLTEEDIAQSEKALSILEEKTNIATGFPELPVLILLDKNTNMYGVAGLDEKFSNGMEKPNDQLQTEFLTPEQKQAMLEKQLAEEEAKRQELLNAMKSATKVVDTNEEYKQQQSENKEYASNYPSYEDNLNKALELTKAASQDNIAKPDDILQEEDGYTLNAQIKKAKKGEIKTGFVIPATLLTEIESQLKGMVVGQVRQSVFDTATGDMLLIPQGTKVIGDYQSDIQYGAKRIFVSWKRLVFPNGSSLDLGSMPGADMSGTSGFKDKYNNHFWEMFGNALLFSLVLTGVNMTQSPDILNQWIPIYGRNASNALSESMGQSLGETLSQMIQKNLNIAPDITIRSGYLFNIMITKDFVLPEYVE